MAIDTAPLSPTGVNCTRGVKVTTASWVIKIFTIFCTLDKEVYSVFYYYAYVFVRSIGCILNINYDDLSAIIAVVYGIGVLRRSRRQQQPQRANSRQ